MDDPGRRNANRLTNWAHRGGPPGRALFVISNAGKLYFKYGRWHEQHAGGEACGARNVNPGKFPADCSQYRLASSQRTGRDKSLTYALSAGCDHFVADT